MNITAKLTLAAALSLGLASAAFGRKMAEPIHIDAALDRPVIQAGHDENVVVQIKIKPEHIVSDSLRPPVNLSLVLDRSGSMQGEKIRQAIAAAQVAVERLGPRDIVSIITYSSDVETVAGSQYATPGNVSEIRDVLASIRAEGSTAIYAGLNRGAAELRKKADEGYINRIVLLSDGLANRGPSSVSDFRSLAGAFAREDIVVSTVGLGNGFNEDVMTTLAAAGQGNAYFVENADDLPYIFNAELGDALNVAATDIEITIKPRAGVRIIRSHGREATITKDQAVFTLPQVYGGHEKLALLELAAPQGDDGESRELVDVYVRYKPASGGDFRLQSVTVPVAYAASDVAVKESVRTDVAANVMVNRIADTYSTAITFSDAGENQAAATEFIKLKGELSASYGGLDNDAFAPLANRMDEEAGYLQTESFDSSRRTAARAWEYQNSTQQSVKVQE